MMNATTSLATVDTVTQAECDRRSRLLFDYLCLVWGGKPIDYADEAVKAVLGDLDAELRHADLPRRDVSTGWSLRCQFDPQHEKIARYIVAAATNSPTSMGWDHPTVIAVAHQADSVLSPAGGMFWFLHAVAAYGLRDQLRAEDSSGQWAKKKDRLYRCYRGEANPVLPCLSFEPIARHFFPGMFDQDRDLPKILVNIHEPTEAIAA